MFTIKTAAFRSLTQTGLLFAVAGPALAQELVIDIIDTVPLTPLWNAEATPDETPGFVQAVSSQQIETSHSIDMTDFLNRRITSVSLNSAQGNPLQTNLQFRGFTASPLLGLSQGLAVYQNGVRINEPFGDALNWDLLPESAIQQMTLLGGANPVYGLNALGGALALEMKNGFSFEGQELTATAGSHDRRTIAVEAGQHQTHWGYYFNAEGFDETGWRDQSESDAQSLYSTLSWRGDASSLDLSVQHASSDLTGNGASPVGLLNIDRAAIFTAPDITENDLTMWMLSGHHALRQHSAVAFNVFHRRTRTQSFNGDASEFSECTIDGAELLIDGLDDDDLPPGLDCDAGVTETELEAAGGEIVEDTLGDPVAAEFGGAPRDAVNNISDRTQTSRGGDFQLIFTERVFDRPNQLIVGTGYALGKVSFNADVEVTGLDPATRTTLNSPDRGTFVEEGVTRVNTETETFSLYFTDTMQLSDALALSVSGRFNRTTTDIRDRSGEQPELNGDHRFQRFNPALGLVWQTAPEANLYVNLSESSRVPTPIELSCNEEIAERAEAHGDDDFECRLPNAFLADPPLEQPIARHVELGNRGDWAGLRYHVGIFRTQVRDDIIFQSTGRATGLFKNIDESRRQGMEWLLSGRAGPLSWSAAYTYLEATFESAFTALSPNHPAADDEGNISVSPGDRVPGLPKHQLKLVGDLSLNETWTIGADLLVQSSQFMRGDESNQLEEIDGFGVVNLIARYSVNEFVDVSLRVANALDTEYETFGLLGEDPTEIPGLETIDRTPVYLGPEPGRSAWIGVRIRL